ncbi:hydroxymethylpyrimidine/phosphomethylpyrimidine kinase [Flavobacterium sp. RHBU_24]|uniref:hydroxymethylpyrimidine/phosphomethylpyrimidine kinase n=1 Tax=Flavobacterium sp. RHBU_24 TaxID=3391185 RepID=UPI003984A064
MDYGRQAILSIAGFDPSGGAGVLADVKTFEQHRCLGFGAVTALTVQTEDAYYKTVWQPYQMVIDQCEPLFNQYKIEVVKIGIIENLDTLLDLVNWIKRKNNNIKIIWDTVLSASAGSSFISSIDNTVLSDILNKVYLITPNSIEACRLTGDEDSKQSALTLAAHCSVYLKGGHSVQEKGVDFLYANDKTTPYLPSEINLPQKHGSGCILSSAIAANLALGIHIEEACRLAKNYIERALKSNENLLGYHVQ